ncbi:MAG: DUF3365 domain-containing protein [Bacteroidales bacterium]|nr:DUF3365 domain-containing protein [Bacteroidales bacterium]MDT8432222.1 DUF3365 domain-containing protein [Bacteroidales bacterium]
MQTLTICLIAAMLIASCGGNSDKQGDQDAANSGKGTTPEQLAAQQEQAIKEKYLKKGSEIATLTQAALLNAVQGAMARGGPAYAVDYCNIEALELKDSLSNLNNCTIQRLSTKYRNPADQPVTKTEAEQLTSYEMLHSEGESLAPTVHIVGNEVEYYQPIMIGSGTCLLCHGDPSEQIATETMNVIRKLYPNDRATGYALNDFRGVWKITFLH